MKVLGSIVGIALLLIVAGLTTCGYKLYKIYDEYPEEAKFENIKSRYPELVANLDKAIASTDSLLSLGNALEKIDYPADTLKVSIQNDDEDDLQVIVNSRLKNAAGKIRVTSGGGGYGQMGKQAYWIFEYPLDKYEYDFVEVLFERELPPKSEN